MSGGVDSSTAAALLVEDGFDVTGVTLDVWPAGEEYSEKSCCGFSAAQDARRVCHKLGIPHYVLNFRDVFEQTVISDFCREYRRGRTPNPCIRCNQLVKFDVLLERAKALGARYLATGHYARIKREAGTFHLLKGIDPFKDQSYVLYTLTQEQLGSILFPLGELTKEKVRDKAATLGLRVAKKPESQEICFVPEGDYAEFVAARCGKPRAGAIEDVSGKVVGRHEGIERYTIGQRKGLGPALPGPKYVVRVEPERNVVVVGGESDLYSSELVAENVSWTLPAAPKLPLAVAAKVRYNMEESPAVVEDAGEGNALVRFERAQRAIAPGQAAVFYVGEEVVGGGTIASVKEGRG